MPEADRVRRAYQDLLESVEDGAPYAREYERMLLVDSITTTAECCSHRPALSLSRPKQSCRRALLTGQTLGSALF